jgi:hypothetical protein
LRASEAVPAQPDRDWVNSWLHRSYEDYWARLAKAATGSRS